ncbi:MAG: LysR substrate-binding domain-containing protein [Burkholderiales bacterium]
MDLVHLANFVRVVDAGGFTAAAAQLHVTQSTLSRQIGLLERDLGQRLLTRTGRGAVATDAGTAFLAHARTLLELAERAREDLRDLNASPRGRVVIGLPPRVAHVLAAPLVQRFRMRFPNAVVTVAEALSLSLREWLIAGRIDLALLFDPPPAPQLVLEELLREPMLLVAPAASPPLPPRVSLARLARTPLVLPRAPNALRALIEGAAAARGTSLRVVAEVDSVHTVLSLVESAAASTVMPASGLAAYGASASLRVAAIGPPAILNRLVLALPRARTATRLVRETAAIARELDFAALAGARPASKARARRKG